MATVTGGDKLNPYLLAVARALSHGDLLRVGFLEGSTYPNGTSIPFVAAMNEFGHENVPPRPFFRRMIDAKSHEWGPALADFLLASDYDVDHSLMMVGEGIKRQLQKSIQDLVSPPLAQSTIDRKGFDKPLIETSAMIKHVGYDVS